jgi:hypothetical protein
VPLRAAKFLGLLDDLVLQLLGPLGQFAPRGTQVACHPIEGFGQPGQFVAAADFHPRVQIPVGDPPSSFVQLVDRPVDDAADDDGRHDADDQD